MAKKPSLLARLCAVPPRVMQRQTWFDSLPDEQQDELTSLRDEFRAGHLKMYTLQQIYDFCQADLNLTIKRSCFTRWLCEKPHG